MPETSGRQCTSGKGLAHAHVCCSRIQDPIQIAIAGLRGTCLPLLLDVRAAAFLAHNAPALAALAPALQAYTSHSACPLLFTLPGAPCEAAFATGSRAPVFASASDAAGTTEAAGALLAASVGGSEYDESARVSAAMAWLRKEVTTSAAPPQDSAALCVDAELALYASACLQRAHAAAATGGLPPEALAGVAACVHIDTAGAAQRECVSAYPVAQAAAVQACCAAARAHSSAKAALKAKRAGTGGCELSAEGLGRWHMLQLLLHSGACYARLLQQLGLGAHPLCAPGPCCAAAVASHLSKTDNLACFGQRGGTR